MKAYLSLGIWSGKIPRGAALFRQDGKGANGGYLKTERQCSLLPALPASASLCLSHLKEIIDDWERQPPNRSEEPP